MTRRKRAGRSPGNPQRDDRDGATLTPGQFDDLGQPVLVAAADLVGRTGAESFQIRYSDCDKPVVWMALALHKNEVREHWSVGAGMDPTSAAIQLLNTLIDGGMCMYCRRPTGVTEDIDTMPLNRSVCWYQYDPELKRFRRGCEGDAP